MFSRKKPATPSNGMENAEVSREMIGSPPIPDAPRSAHAHVNPSAIDPTPGGTAQTAVRTSPTPSSAEIGFAVAFSRIVSLLVRSPHYKHYALSDLEWLVIPPVALGQCATMEANANGRSVPIAAAFWASVSDEVDKKLSENLSAPLKLRPDEWRSGDTLWLVDAIGDPKAVPELLKQLHETAFKDRRIKIRKRVAPGNPSVES